MCDNRCSSTDEAQFPKTLEGLLPPSKRRSDNKNARRVLPYF